MLIFFGVTPPFRSQGMVITAGLEHGWTWLSSLVKAAKDPKTSFISAVLVDVDQSS